MIMEGIITQKVTPLLKCFVLFLFIFTAKVLTSRPQDADSRNEIQHVKPSHYVRTFTKYHHRRTIQWNQDVNYWPLTQEQKTVEKRNTEEHWPDVNPPKVIIPYSKRSKRSLDQESNENIGNFEKNAILAKVEQKNIVFDPKKVKVKAAATVTEAPSTTMGPTISCLYKIHSVSISVTPITYTEDKNAQMTVENVMFERGPITEEVLPSGPSLVEKCMHPQATCYTLWHQDKEGNITVLGQGCWKASQSNDGESVCDKCTRVTPRPDTKFCCCTKTYCNADFTSLKEESVTIKAESTMKATERAPDSYNEVYMYLFPVFLVVAMVMMASLYCDTHCHKQEDTPSQGEDVEKGEIMGSGPDALATGLSCVDNLTLIEHIGQGKFGTVWRGSLGSTPVAVKLYSNATTWQKEAAIYSLPHLSHPNILRYYGSDTRATLTEGGGREHLIVLELCAGTLRSRLERSPLHWVEFAALAHGLASALAHLHTPSGSKPCIVHRDVNSNNVLVTANGSARLADLGLATVLQHRRPAPPTRITEAGTLRYLAPEALDGALDLSGAGAALCAVDVYALGLVLWEMLWRTRGAHRGAVPPYSPPYADRGLPDRPTLTVMQTLVSRNKVRPPLPRPAQECRAARIAADTCDECWDHDAEARLTAVCVEERMSELKQLVCTQPPHIHDNMLHSHTAHAEPVPVEDKNSNCEAAPLLYPRPQLGRNACIERNTHTTHNPPVQLIHKSLKDISLEHTPENREPRVSNEENCLSVARPSIHRVPLLENSVNETRSYQRPLAYVPNDVTAQDPDRGPKQTNLLQGRGKPKWGIRRFLERFNRRETEVKLVPENRTRTSVVDEIDCARPSNLVLEGRTFNYEAPCLSPPNRTLSPTMMEEVLGFKELPAGEGQIFAVIVPKAKPAEQRRGSETSVDKSVRTLSSSVLKSTSESEDSVKKPSCASIDLELQYIDNAERFESISPFDLNSDCSSSEDEHLMLLSENGGSKITMQPIPRSPDVLKESTQKGLTFNKQNRYANFDNEFSDPNDKENVGYGGDNPVYLAALKGEIETDLRMPPEAKSPKPSLKSLAIKRQHSLEQVSELFASAGDLNLLNPAGRVKTPGDLPVAVRRARRDRALQKGRASESNRLSLYDDRMMFGNSL